MHASSCCALAVVAMALTACAPAAAEENDVVAKLNERVAALEERLAEAEARATAPSGVLRVRGLVVLDDKGRERVVLGDRESYVGLHLLDAEGKRRASLSVNQHRDPGLALYDRNDHVRFGAQLAHGDAPYVGLWGGKDREKRLRIEAPIEGAVGIGLWGGPGAQNETSHTGWWIWEDGTIAWGGGLRSEGRTGFLLKYGRDGKSGFEMRDADEQSVWSLPAPK